MKFSCCMESTNVRFKIYECAVFVNQVKHHIICGKYVLIKNVRFQLIKIVSNALSLIIFFSKTSAKCRYYPKVLSNVCIPTIEKIEKKKKYAKKEKMKFAESNQSLKTPILHHIYLKLLINRSAMLKHI